LNLVRNIALFLFAFTLSCSAFAQYNQWTWIKGNTSLNQPAVYGTQGVPSAANHPGSIYESGEWTDQQGNFWLYSGNDYTTGLKNNLWKYDPVTNMWTWIKGNSTAPTVFGTLGIPSATNTPGGRMVPATWVDNNGMFWMFGGALGMNDLWKYDPGTNMWTWMGGSNVPNAGVYGVKGVAAATNLPPSRYETSCTWVDNNGNLWLFGGDRNGPGRLNDLWKYDIGTNMWTWMSGSNTTGQAGVYGAQGVANSSNVPGARTVFASWKDISGNLWLFGGAEDGVTFLNDLWKYDIIADQWTWMNGSNVVNQPGVYGTKCIPAPGNVPGARMENRTRWTDDCGNFWMFGGVLPGFSDLWRYTVSTNIWTWVSGSSTTNQLGSYGTQGVSSTTNYPRSRAGALGWKDLNSNFWLFAGAEQTLNSTLNDLWRYVPDRPAASFTKSSSTGCAPVTINFTSSSTPGCNEMKSHLWNFGDPGSGVNNTSSVTNPAHTYNANGTYTVTLLVTNCTGGKDSTTQTISIIGTMSMTLTSTQAGCISSNGTATVNHNSGTSPYTYIWSNGQITQTSTALAAGNYTATVTDATGCTQTQTVAVTSNSTLTVTVSSTQAGCTGNNGTATVNVSGGTNPLTYSWNNGQTTSVATALVIGNYTVTVTDANGCTQTQTVAVTSNSSLSATVTSTKAGCTVSNGTATVNPSSGTAPYTYSWNNGQTTSVAVALSSGSYTVIITDAGGCSNTQTVSVTSNSALSLNVTSTQSGCTLNNGTATANPANGITPYSYSWNNGQSTQTATGLAVGNYTAVVTDANGCTQMQTVSVTQITGPTVVASASPSAITAGASSTLIATGGGTYFWSPATDLSCTTCANPTATPPQTTSYCVLVTDNNGCEDSTCIVVTVDIPCGTIYIPNAFSPNHDGENDMLQVYYGNIACIKTLELIIYNRWGEKVFETNDPAFTWNGIYKSKLLNTAVFDYYLDATLTTGEKINKKGNISLLR